MLSHPHIEQSELSANSELVEAHSRLERVLDGITDGLFVLDREWRFIYFTDQGARMIGISREEAVGRNIWEMYPHSEGTKFYDLYHQAVATGEPVEFEEYYPEPLNAWYECRAYPSHEGLSVYFRDVTDRRTAKIALLRSEAKMRAVFRSLAEGVVFFNPEGQIEEANHAFAGIRGHNAADLADLELDLRNRMVRPDGTPFPADEQPAHIALRTRKAVRDVELGVPSANGEICWKLVNAHPVYTDSGELLGAVASFVDITDRKRAEEVSRSQAELLRLSFDAIFVWKLDGTIESWNTGAQRLYGFSQEEAVGRVTHDLLVTVLPGPWLNIRAELAAQGAWEGELAQQTKDGRRIFVSARFQIIQGADGIDRVLEIARDITERRHAEEALRDSEERFRTLADNISQFAWMADPQGSIFWYNRRWYDYTGTTSEARPSPTTTLGTEEPWPLSPSTPDKQACSSEAQGSPGAVPNSRETTFSAVPGGQNLRDSSEAQGPPGAVPNSRETTFSAAPGGQNLRDSSEAQGPPDGAPNSRETTFSAVPGGQNLRGPSEAPRGWGWRTVHHPDHIDRVVRSLARSIETGQPWEETFPLRAKDGTYRWFLSRALPIRDAENRVVRWFGTNTDITEQLDIQEQLRVALAKAGEGADLLDALMEHIPIGVTVADASNWRVLRTSRYGRQLREEVSGFVGRSYREQVADWQVYLSDGKTRAKADDLPLSRAMSTGEIVAGEEYLAIRKDGERLAVLGTAAPILDRADRIVAGVATWQDISGSKRADEARRASQLREKEKAADLAAVFDAAPVAVFISHDRDCREMVGSRAAYDLLRLPLGSNVSKSAPENERPAFHIQKDGHDVQAKDLPVQTAASTGKPVNNYQFDLVYPDGISVNLLGNAVPLFDENGNPSGAVGAFVDVTEMKRNEERLRQSQKLESIGLLAGGIAHDFNNLLTGVLGYASLALDDAGPKAANRIKQVISSAEKAASLTRQLLAYSGKGQFVTREIDVSEAVHEIGGLVELSIPKSVQLMLNVQRRLPSVSMDPSQLQQILMNLIINAGEAIGDEVGGKVTVKTTSEWVEEPFLDAVGAQVERGRYVTIEVHDTGAGIEAEMKSKIFDPFFTTKFTGRGLGLAAVSGILRSEKGGITVHSSPGQGTTFRVFLPESVRPPANTTEEHSGDEPVILVVDDEPSVREFITAVLERERHSVMMAADGREALEIFKKEKARIRAVILDIMMPVSGANQVLPELKKIAPELKVLLTSGYSEFEATKLCAAYPGTRFIQKPYTVQQLSKVLEQLLAD